MTKENLNGDVFHSFLKLKSLNQMFLNELINEGRIIKDISVRNCHPFSRLRFFSFETSLLGASFWLDIELKWVKVCQLNIYKLSEVAHIGSGN